MEKVCVYTCITGDYDNLKEVIVKEDNIDYICFTNNKEISSSTWKIIYIEDEKLSNHYLSRKLKMIGHPYIEKNYDLSIWIDASIMFKKSVNEFLSEYFDLTKDLLAACKHSSRNSIREEAAACIKYKKDSEDLINNLLQFYKKEKFLDNLGLLEMTLIVKRHNNSLVKKTMKLWFDMLLKYSKRDQLSFMYCLYKTNLPFKVIPIEVWNNDYLEFSPHNSGRFDYTYQIYYDYGEGFNENDSEKNKYLKSADGIYTINLSIKEDLKGLRLDLTNVEGIAFDFIKFNTLEKKDLVFKDFLVYDNKYITTSVDPQIIINRKIAQGENIIVSMNIKILKKRDFLSLISSSLEKEKELTNQILEEQKNNKNLRLEISNMLNSTSWKVTKPLRLLSSKLKK